MADNEVPQDQGGMGIAHMATTTVKVDGMTCGACTSAVESGFEGVDGAGTVSVSLVMGRAVVQHDPKKLPAQQIADIIEDRGFDADIISTNLPLDPSIQSQESTMAKSVTTTVSISGMTCGACTSAVEGAFQAAPGLKSFNISLLAERAVLVHDPSKLSTDQIVENIEDAGFDAKVVSSEAETDQPVNTSSSVQLKIYGLADGAAATTLEDSLREKAGVQSAIITLSTSRATVVYTPSLIGLRKIVESIEELGFNALVADSDDNNARLESLAKTKGIQEWRYAFLFSLAFAIPVFCISMLIPMFLPAFDFGSAILIPGLTLGDLLCFVLTIPVQFGIGKRFYVSAYKSLKHKSPTMDVLVVLGTSAAFFYSCFAVLVSVLFPPHPTPSTVFDTSSMLITFITLGRWLENRAKGQTSAALSRLMSLAPSMATIYDDPIAAEKAAEGWDEPFSPTVPKKAAALIDKETVARRRAAGEKLIPTELIQVGDVVILRPGDKIPADGTVTRGESYIDEAMVTGEAMHVLKKKGSILIAGTVNQEGRVDFRVTRAGKDTQLSQIVNLVQEAQTSRAPIQKLADRVAGVFVPVIIALGLITFTGWMILSHILPHPPEIFLDDHSGGKFMVCLKLCISVIVFACPCALGLATPTAVMVGTGTGAENGILVKGGAALETATKITHVVLDKTGTLTMGKMTVADTNMDPVWSSSEWRRQLWWSIVGLAEMSSEHPVGKAIFNAAKEQLGIGEEDAIDGSIGEFENTVGKGISALVEPASSAERARYQIFVGNEQFLDSKGIKVPDSMDPDPNSSPDRNYSSRSRSPKSSGVTSIHIAIAGKYAGTIALSDSLKPTAPAAIAALHKMGISTSLVTGDTYNTAVSVAKLVGISQDSVRASVLPHQKQEIVAELKAQGETVAMVGDGINDSPALACANVGIALSSGTDVAMEAADIVLMRGDDLLNIPASLDLSRKIFKRIQTNLILSCIYNVVGLPFAMGLFLPAGLMLHPMAAGAAMAASSVTVVSNSLLLKLWKRPSWMSIEALEKHLGEGVKDPVSRRRRGFLGSAVHMILNGVDSIVSRIRSTKGSRKDVAYVPLTTVEP